MAAWQIALLMVVLWLSGGYYIQRSFGRRRVYNPSDPNKKVYLPRQSWDSRRRLACVFLWPFLPIFFMGFVGRFIKKAPVTLHAIYFHLIMGVASREEWEKIRKEEEQDRAADKHRSVPFNEKKGGKNQKGFLRLGRN